MERFKDFGKASTIVLFAASALTPSPVNADDSAAFQITALGLTETTCRVQDPDCALETTLVATNISGRDLYRPTWWTGIHSERWAKIYGLEYRPGAEEGWKWGMTELSDQVVRPGESIIAQVRYQPPQRYELYGTTYENPSGSFKQRMYADGYSRNNQVQPPNDVPYGGSHIELTVNRIP